MGTAATALLVLGLGLAGMLNAAWGYALFTLAGLSFAAALAVVATLMLTRLGDVAQLLQQSRQFAGLGVASYVLAVAAMGGYYGHEALAGRIETHWAVFGPIVLAALVSFEWGIYRKLVQANLPTLQRYRRHMRRQDADPKAMRTVLIDDVLVQRSLWQVSKFRWLRHSLIFWGFGAMFLVELLAVFVREAVPAFGWTDIWRVPGHPIRLAFDLAYEVTGTMMLLGCVLALVWRVTVQGKPERKFADTPMVLALLFVVVTGFLLEGWRIALGSPGPGTALSFVGVPTAKLLKSWGLIAPDMFQPLWLIHVIASCALIGLLPFTRLVHTCATPFGRLLNSQRGLLVSKKLGSLSGLLLPRPATKPVDHKPAGTHPTT